jgi:hypothetical protein
VFNLSETLLRAEIWHKQQQKWIIFGGFGTIALLSEIIAILVAISKIFIIIKGNFDFVK